MNIEILDRIMTAKAYQKKAILALFPEEMNGHLEGIEKELKWMAGEVLRAVLCETCARGNAEQKYHDTGAHTNINTEKEDSGDRRSTRKIEIV